MAAAINLAQGKVVSLTGKVIAIAADGSQRILKLGDVVAVGERLIVPADGAIELQAGNGNLIKVAEARDLTITDDVFGNAPSDATDAAIAPLNQDAQQILAALEAGQDPLQELEATAAGLTAGGGEDGGSSFVVISRVAESVAPLTLDNQIDNGQQATVTTADGAPVVAIDDVTTVTINNVGPSRDNTPLLTGTGEAGATVAITDAQGQTVATTVVAADGTWSVESSVPLPDGTNGLTALATDASGNTATATGNAVIDTVTTVTIQNVGPTKESVPVFVGTGEPGATIVVTAANGDVLGNTTVRNDGSWSLTSSQPLPDGSSVVSVTATDVLGNTASNTGSVQIDTTATPAPTVIITEDVNNDGIISNSELEGQVDVTIGLPNGTVAGDTLTIVFGGTTQTLVLTAANISRGLVEIQVPVPEEGAQLTVTATITDQVGNTSPEGSDTARINTVEIAGIDATGATVVEGNTMSFVVNLTKAGTQATSFDFSLQDGTATSVDDYQGAIFGSGVTFDPATGRVTVPAGVSSFTVTVPTNDDAVIEQSETVLLSVGGQSAVGTILDNDAVTGVSSITPANAIEGEGLFFSVTLTGTTTAPTTFDFVLQDGTTLSNDYGTVSFTNGVTYDAASGKVTVPAGVGGFTVILPTVDDTAVEGNETLLISLGGQSATGTIVDNDSNGGTVIGVSSVSPASTVEGGNLSFTVALTGTTDAQIALDFVLQDGTTTADDYNTLSFTNGVSFDATTGKLTVPVGVSSFSVVIATTDDSIIESSETLQIVVGGQSATGTIADNDAVTPPPTIEHIGKPDPNAANPNDVATTEGGDLTFTVKLSGTTPPPKAATSPLPSSSAAPPPPIPCSRWR